MKSIHPFLRHITLALSVTLFMALTGCATPVKEVATGQAVVADRLAVEVDHPWNQFGGLLTRVPTWTNEGVTVDALEFYVGIKDGQKLPFAPVKDAPPLVFKSQMQPSDVVALFQNGLTRDGSSFQLDKLEPATFLNTQGFRFEYSLNRKSDDVQMKGVVVASIVHGELFLMHYSAPRLVFFSRYKASFDGMVKSAHLVG